MEFSAWQKELLAILCEKGLSRSDLYSVMLVLTREEHGKGMLAWLKEEPSASSEEIFEKAGKIAFGDRS